MVPLREIFSKYVFQEDDSEIVYIRRYYLEGRWFDEFYAKVSEELSKVFDGPISDKLTAAIRKVIETYTEDGVFSLDIAWPAGDPEIQPDEAKPFYEEVERSMISVVGEKQASFIHDFCSY